MKIGSGDLAVNQYRSVGLNSNGNLKVFCLLYFLFILLPITQFSYGQGSLSQTVDDNKVDNQTLFSTPDQTIENIPKTLLLSDNSGDTSRLPIVYAIENYRVATEVSDSISSQFQGEIYGWIPGLTFGFDRPSEVGLINIKNLLIGQIKNYESQKDILDEATYWQDIPINEEVFLPLDHTGLNYMVADVQFVNNTSGIYSTVLKVEPDQDSKFLAEYWMEEDMDEGADYNIVDDSDIEDAELSPAAQGTYSAIICQHIVGYGFQTCSDNITGGGEPDTKIIYPENAGENNQDEEDEEDEDEDDEDD